jgi:hypothetical protein
MATQKKTKKTARKMNPKTVRVRQIENGFVVSSGDSYGRAAKEFYAVDKKSVGTILKELM